MLTYARLNYSTVQACNGWHVHCGAVFACIVRSLQFRKRTASCTSYILYQEGYSISSNTSYIYSAEYAQEFGSTSNRYSSAAVKAPGPLVKKSGEERSVSGFVTGVTTAYH